jgi:hypothetical protein
MSSDSVVFGILLGQEPEVCAIALLLKGVYLERLKDLCFRGASFGSLGADLVSLDIVI